MLPLLSQIIANKDIYSYGKSWLSTASDRILALFDAAGEVIS